MTVKPDAEVIMRGQRILNLSVTLSMILMLAGCNLPLQSDQDQITRVDQSEADSPTTEPVKPTLELRPTKTALEEGEDRTPNRVEFGQLGISLEVPEDLHVVKNIDVNYEDPGKMTGYQFYIQNYGQRGGPSSGNFQMYGHIQYDLPPTSWEEFASNLTNSPNHAYVTEIEVNGLRGFDTQFSGVRNRYVYYFYLNGRILSIAVAEPSEANKTVSDRIINTIQFDQEKFSSESRIQKVLEPEGYYQLYIPGDWTYSFGDPAGIRLSDFQARSSDYEVEIQKTDGPHDDIYHKNGITMSLVILADESAKSEPVAAEIKSALEVTYSGIEMTDYIFVEPSTAEGEIRELRFYHNGLSYLLRFSYTEDFDQGIIDWIIINLELKQD
jgi:hypothetical protein